MRGCYLTEFETPIIYNNINYDFIYYLIKLINPIQLTKTMNLNQTTVMNTCIKADDNTYANNTYNDATHTNTHTNTHIWCLDSSCLCSYEEFATQQDLNIHYKLFHTNLENDLEDNDVEDNDVEDNDVEDNDVEDNDVDNISQISKFKTFLNEFKLTFGKYDEVDILFPLWFKNKYKKWPWLSTV